MNAALPQLRGPSLWEQHHRIIGKLTMIVVLVSLLTSEAVWARFFAVVGADDGQYAAMAPIAPISAQEKALMIKLSDDPGMESTLAPTDAIERNEAIPFAQGTVASAKPFQLFSSVGGTAHTALRCLTQAVYHEAAFEPLAGRRAVAQVVLNRMRHPAFPKSVCGVVYQGVNRPVCQFSFTCDGSLNRRPSPAAWREAEAVAEAALNGHVESSVGYSTHYHANYVSPYWAPTLVKINKIGAHIFYRWPGGAGTPAAFSGRHAGTEAIPVILPRAMVVRRKGEAGGQAQAGAGGTMSGRSQDGPPEADVGGRIDTSKGWALELANAEEADSVSRISAQQQEGGF